MNRHARSKDQASLNDFNHSRRWVAWRARWVGVFMAAIPLSSVIGGPISGLILDTFNGVMGLSGWQWLFIIEGVPSVLVGLWVLSYLTDQPREAPW
jgi:MFS transporter, ACS family, tartrate transporter